MELVGYIALGIMGMTLGLVGAGGSILTIPILIYFLGIPILLATTYSLIVVGTSALVAAIRYRQSILFKKAINFSIPSVIGVFATRHFIIPNLPSSIGGISIEEALFILLLIFMSLAGYFMTRNITYTHEARGSTSYDKPIRITLIAFVLGSMMGLLGSGGGFLIVPILVLLMGFNMKEAVPSSLFIISINSFIGFAADKHLLLMANWMDILKYLICALFGMFIGIHLSKLFNAEQLKKFFGYFIWVIGIAIFAEEFI